MARVIHTSQAERLGKEWVTKFKEYVDRQMFEVVIQAVAGKRIVARATLQVGFRWLAHTKDMATSYDVNLIHIWIIY